MYYTDKYLSRVGRKNQIESVVSDFHQQGKITATITDIAKAINMKPSTHLRKILAEMCNENRIHCSRHKHRPNIEKFMYHIPDVKVVKRGFSWY